MKPIEKQRPMKQVSILLHSLESHKSTTLEAIRYRKRTHFPVLLTQSSLRPEGRDLVETVCLGLSVQVSHSLPNVWLWVSVAASHQLLQEASLMAVGPGTDPMNKAESFH